MARSTETIRLTLKAYDREHPDRAIFPARGPPLDDEAKGQIYRRYRMGVSVEVLAGQFGRTRSSIYRVINEMRAGGSSSTKLEFMPQPELRRSRPRRPRSSAPMPAAGRRQGTAAAQGAQGTSSVSGQPLRGAAP